MRDLLELLAADRENPGWARLQSLEAVEDGLRLTFGIRPSAPNPHAETWEISCRFAASYRIEEPWGDDLALADTHPVLWPHCEPAESLYFAERPGRPEQVVSDLLGAHRAACGEWLPFERTVNHEVALFDLVAGGYGQLAHGPVTLVRAYAAVLAAHGMRPNLLGAQPTRCADGSPVASVPADLRALILGRTYVAGVGFEARRVT